MAGSQHFVFVIIVAFLVIQGEWFHRSNEVNCLKFTTEPQTISVNVQQTVILRCEFDTPVDECQWRRSDWPVVLGGRYSFVRGDGKNSRSCSLEIKKIESIDFSKWTCAGILTKGGSISSKPIDIVNKKFVGVRENVNNTLLVDKVFIKVMETMEVTCTLQGTNQNESTYQWEYQRSSSDPWDVYDNGQTITLTDTKLGNYRCSVIEDNSRHYSLEYHVSKSEGEKVSRFQSNDVIYLVIGAAAGSSMMIAFGVILAYYIKSNYTVKYKRNKKGTPNQPESEAEPLLNNESSIARNTPQIEEPSSGGTVFDWKITDYKIKKMDEANGHTICQLSDAFKVNGTNYNFRVKLYLNGLGDGKNSFMSILLEVLNPDLQQNADFHHKRKILLLDQSGNGRHICWEYEPSFKSKEGKKWMKNPWGPLDFFSSTALEYTKETYVRQRAICLRVIIEPLVSLTDQLVLDKKDPVFIWRIDNFYQRLQDESDDICRCIESEPFYCFPGGYRVKCLVYLNGCGKGRNRHISIFYGFLNGQHDEFLPPVFPHRAILKILDQNDLSNGKHIKRKHSLSPNEMNTDEGEEKMKGFHGFISFIERKKIQSEPYLVNNCLLIQIAILPLYMTDRSLRLSISSYTQESELMPFRENMGTDVV